MPSVMLIRMASDYQVALCLLGVKFIFIRKVRTFSNMPAVQIFFRKMISKGWGVVFFISIFHTIFHPTINRGKFFSLLKSSKLGYPSEDFPSLMKANTKRKKEGRN